MEKDLGFWIKIFFEQSPAYAIKEGAIKNFDVQRLLQVAFYAYENGLSIPTDDFIAIYKEIGKTDLSDESLRILARQAQDMLDYMNQLNNIGLEIVKKIK